MKITTLTCPSCKDEIYSRTTHDFRRCSCGEIFIDGGFDYCRFGFEKQKPEFLERELDVTQEELYNDWNKGQDKYGVFTDFSS